MTPNMVLFNGISIWRWTSDFGVLQIVLGTIWGSHALLLATVIGLDVTTLDLDKVTKGKVWASPWTQYGPWTIHNILDNPCRGQRSVKDIVSDHPGWPWEGSPRRRLRRFIVTWTSHLGVCTSHSDKKVAPKLGLDYWGNFKLSHLFNKMNSVS